MTTLPGPGAPGSDRLREELFEFLRIPSISANPEYSASTREAGEWIIRALRRAGLDAELLETDGHPVALGEWMGAGPNAPTLLIYGHYDVQPPEPLHLWTSPPFEPELRDGRIYARGAADDKSQIFLHVKALENALSTHGTLPVNVVFMAEGEEEIASPHLLSFLEANRGRLKGDALVISDSAMFGPDLPSLLFSLRGLAYTEIHVRATGTDLHSGSYGGTVPNAATVLARILAGLHDPSERVAIPGFYDAVVKVDEALRERIRRLPFDEAGLLAETGAHDFMGEAGYSVAERLWIRPTCEVNGLLSGYTGEGAKTVIPESAMAKVSFRLVPDQDPDVVIDLLRAHVESQAPPQVEVEVVPLHGGRPWRADVKGPFFEAARRALETGFGRSPVLTGEGASIPIVTDLERLLGVQSVLMGFALPGANMHAPDEWFPDAHLGKGLATLLAFYDELRELV